MSSSSVIFVIVRSHISSKRLEYRECKAKEASQEHGNYKGQVDPVSETEREKNGNHFSQSSARSGRSRHSSRERQRSRHPSPCSNSVNDLSFCLFLLELMHLLMFLKSRFTIVTIRCILAVKWSRNQLIFFFFFTWSSLIGCRNGYLLIGWGSWTELAALQKKVVSCLKMCCHVFLL